MASLPKITTTSKPKFDTIRDLVKLSNSTGVNVWKAVAAKLSASASQRTEVNLSRIEKFATEGDKLIVPGKVLATGTLSKKVTIIGFSASESARAKIEKAGAKFVTINEYISDEKVDSKVKIFG